MPPTDPVTLRAARARAGARLATAGVPSPDADAALLLEALTGLSRSAQALAPNLPLSEGALATLEGWLARRERREPLQHILGVAPFYGLDLAVGPEVLVPRFETERLVEIALERLAPLRSPRVLDVGTGSGAIALAVRQMRPDAEVLATDLAPAALEAARRNAERLGLEVAFARSDLLAAPEVRAFAERADALLANPPYLPAGDRAALPPEVERDPEGALFSGEDGLDHLRRLERQARSALPPGAFALVELDPRNVRAALRSARGWRRGEVLADLAGRERFLLLER